MQWILAMIMPLLEKFGIKIDDLSPENIAVGLPTMVHYAKYVKENGYDVPYTDFLPVLINLEKFLPPVPPEICYADYGCFNNFESFKCLEGAIPDDPKEIEYSDDGSFSLIVPNSLDEIYHDYWKGTSRLVLIVHGMNGDSKDDGIRGIQYDFPGTKTIYLEYEKEVSGKNYFNILQAYQNIRIVSILGAELLEHALRKGIKAKHMHLIGFSLGAHTASLVAKKFTEKTDEKVGRLTGLDPAGPFAENCDAEVRIDQTDASFVDLIISNPGQLPNLGLELPLGHVNFYINDSEKSPCFDSSCKHHRAVDIWKLRNRF